MIRRLIAMRHAKAGVIDGPDHLRPLTGKGRRQAPQIAARLIELGWLPERAISSDSARTQETWARMCDVLPGPIPMRFTRALYLAEVDPIIDEISAEEPKITSLLVLGHNPGWEDFVALLTGATIQLGTADAALLVGAGDTWGAALRPRGWMLHGLLHAPGFD